MKIFVYGTLKQGFGNNYLLKDATFVSKAETVRPFVMHDSGFPVCIPSDKGLPVIGEIFEFEDPDILKRLDQLEGEGHMFLRRKFNVWVKASDDSPEEIEEEVSMYIGNPAHWQGQQVGTQWVTNDAKFEWKL